MNELYNITKERHQKLLKALDGKYFVIWECEFDRAVKEDPDVRQFVQTFQSVPPLQIRQSLAGGIH